MKNENTTYPLNAVNLENQRGASLLEGIAYLGIAALVVLGAVSMLTSASSSAKSNQMTEELVALRTATKKMYTGQAFPVANIITTLNTAKALPSTLVYNTGTSTLTNAWGGAITIAGAAGGGSFTITYNGVPQDVCVSAMSGATGWSSVAGNGGAAITTMPLSAANALTVCSVATSAGNVVTLTAT
jgi:type II secretory pathway pseudopilin PulG